MGQETQTPHKRRVRYKGKYPRKFEEKYKELNPEKYKDTIEHVISKGNTPAGMHISIMVNEILDFLKIQPGETGFDANTWIWRSYKSNDGVPAWRRTYVRDGRRSGRISKNPQTSC